LLVIFSNFPIIPVNFKIILYSMLVLFCFRAVMALWFPFPHLLCFGAVVSMSALIGVVLVLSLSRCCVIPLLLVLLLCCSYILRLLSLSRSIAALSSCSLSQSHYRFGSHDLVSLFIFCKKLHSNSRMLKHKHWLMFVWLWNDLQIIPLSTFFLFFWF